MVPATGVRIDEVAIGICRWGGGSGDGYEGRLLIRITGESVMVVGV